MILGFQNAQDDQRCVRADTRKNTTSFLNAQSYCESVGGMIAKINDILEIQHLLPKYMLFKNDFEIYLDSRVPWLSTQVNYFWIDRTSDISHRDKTLNSSISKCTLKASKSIDRNCIAVLYEKTITDNVVTYDPCIIESNECSSISAVPVCVDKHLKSDSTFIPLTEVGNGSTVSINTTIDYSCGDDKEYHLLDGYCYKLNIHETTWQEAKSQCERENATLFLPENLLRIKLIRSLFSRRQTYTSSGILHVGVIYDNKNRTIKIYNSNNGSGAVTSMWISNLYYICEASFREHYRKLISSSTLSTKEKERLKNEQTACAYTGIQSEDRGLVSCDDIRCNRLATGICQKTPVAQMQVVVAQRLVVYTSNSEYN